MDELSRGCLKLCGSLLFSLMVHGMCFSHASTGTDILPLNISADSLARYLTDRSGISGGLIVHLGSGDGLLTSALRTRESFIVHGLDRNPDKVEQSRIHIHKRGDYGPVSVDHWCGDHLPYAENLVNLIIAEDPGQTEMDEIFRVLAPRGVALLNQGGSWKKATKPWPGDIDEWTHYLHGPSNNAVADDSTVGPPQSVQWISPPRWSRSHEHLANLSAAVSAGGRLFYIMDMGPAVDITMPSKWTLVARDAFNGAALWEKPVGPWEWRFRPFRTGPPDLARRLVAAGDTVYVTPGYGKPVVSLDGATGKTLRVYDQTINAQEIIYSEGVLYLVTGEEAPDMEIHRHHADPEKQDRGFPDYYEERPPTRLMAVDAFTGKTIWHKTSPETGYIMPTTLAVAEGRLYFQNTQHVICLEVNGGAELWRSERPVSVDRRSWSAPTLVVYDDVVLSADRRVPDNPAGESQHHVRWRINVRADDIQEGEIIAFAAGDGQRLWSAPCYENFNSPVDILVAGGLVWTGNLVGTADPGIVEGRDPRTGEVKRTRPADHEFYNPTLYHSRCYRNKATNRFLITSRAGVEFQDVETGKAIANHWVRGECQYGILPANGLLYAPPHPCACFILAKLNSFHALSAGPAEPVRSLTGRRLEKGIAYDKSEPPCDLVGDWPTYRHDPGRSGYTSASVPVDLKMDWRIELKPPLTAPVAAAGRVYVASGETHTLYAIDAISGSELWSFTAGGRIDSPPTIWQGRVFFGSADGRVYCLSSEDGSLAWRYRAALADRLIVVDGQLESAWPVHGSVVVLPGPGSEEAVVYASAGRSSYLDGGIVMARLDARTGRDLSTTVVNSRDPETGHQPHPMPLPTPGQSMPGALNDILSAGNNSVFMRHMQFNLDGEVKPYSEPHLHSPAGFLDDSWWHRTYWIAGDKMDGGYGYWPLMGNLVPSGRLLVIGGENIFGFGRDRYSPDGSHVGLGRAGYRLFARRSSVHPRRHAESEVFPWEKQTGLYVRAMVLADKTLFVAGPDDPLAAEDPVSVWEGRSGGQLWAICADSGEKKSGFNLDAPPVFDGMIAIPGRLIFSAMDGSVVSFSDSGSKDQLKDYSNRVKIGNQEWMTLNLDVSIFMNGDSIPEAKTGEQWERLGEKGRPAWCYYQNDPDNGDKYGRLYNWYAVNDHRGLCPEGWRVPASEDWEELIENLDGRAVAGGKLKDTGTWSYPNTGATNETGFTALPGNLRYPEGTFWRYSRRVGYWWTTTEDLADTAWGYYLLFGDEGVGRGYYNKQSGFSVRCIKDQGATSSVPQSLSF